MHHGRKLKKLQGSPSHRMAKLRNLVSALLHHESIKTTLPKAKITARMADKIITLGKKNTDPTRRLAMAFLMPAHYQSPESFENCPTPPPRRPLGYPSVGNADPEEFEPPKSILPKLFSTLASRYANRTGGYTRIHKFGRRQGDNAPHAIVSLVDGPRDLKFEMIARTVGRETAYLGQTSGMTDAVEDWEGLDQSTKKGVEQVLKYRGEEGRKELEEKAREFADILFAEEKASDGHHRLAEALEKRSHSERSRLPKPYKGRRHLAGERMAGMSIADTGLGIARGALGRGKWHERGPSEKQPRFLTEVGRSSEATA